jgi:hypothetical protein
MTFETGAWYFVPVTEQKYKIGWGLFTIVAKLELKPPV